MKIQQCLFKILKKQNVTDARTHGHTDGRTDGQRENSIPTTNKVCGGIKTFLLRLRFFQNWEKGHLISIGTEAEFRPLRTPKKKKKNGVHKNANRFEPNLIGHPLNNQRTKIPLVCS